MPEKVVDKERLIADLIVTGVGVKCDFFVPTAVAEGIAQIIIQLFPKEATNDKS